MCRHLLLPLLLSVALPCGVEAVSVPIAFGAELPAAFANEDVRVIELTQDVKMLEEDWNGFVEVPIVLTRNVTITSSPDLTRPAVLDMNFVARKARLGPRVSLTFEHVVMLNWRSGLGRASPGIDLLDARAPPPPGEPRPMGVVNAGFMYYRLCFGRNAQNVANAATRRPDELPGAQTVLTNQLQGGCVNDTSAPLMDRCWADRYLIKDMALEAWTFDSVGVLSKANYIVHLTNVTSLCEHILSDECVAQYTALGCWARAEEALSRGADLQPPLPQAAAGMPAAASAGPGADAGEQLAGGGHNGGNEEDWKIRILLPALLSGIASILLVAAGVVLWSWRRERRRGRGAAHKALSAAAAGAVVCTGASVDAGGGDAQAPLQQTCSCVIAEADGPSVPHRAAAAASPPAPVLGSGDSPAPASNPFMQGNGRLARTATPSFSMVTLSTPVQAHVRVDLRWGLDFQVDDTALRGAGSYGRVVEGNYQGSRVAVKVMHMGPGGTSELALQSLRQEVEVLSRCSHPNVVTLLGASLAPPRVCLVMELMEQSLAQKLCACGRLLPLDEVYRITLGVAQGLAYLHPTITHRDLKLANILLDAGGTAKLTDFGLARLRETVAPTSNPEAGTVPYTAPECYNPGNTTISHKADIYSWAVLLWELLSGSMPWKGQNPLAVALAVGHGGKRLSLDLPHERCPCRLKELITECWDQDPQRRPSAEEIIKRTTLIMHSPGASDDGQQATGCPGALPPAVAGGNAWRLLGKFTEHAPPPPPPRTASPKAQPEPCIVFLSLASGGGEKAGP